MFYYSVSFLYDLVSIWKSTDHVQLNMQILCWFSPLLLIAMRTKTFSKVMSSHVKRIWMITYVNTSEIFKCTIYFSYWHNHTSHLVSVMHRCSVSCFTSVFRILFGTWVIPNASACCPHWSLCPVILQHLCNRLPATFPPDTVKVQVCHLA